MKISELPQATEVTGEEILPVVQNGETKKVSRDNLVGTVPDGIRIETGTVTLLSNGETVGESASLPKITIDGTLSTTSENAVSNKVVTEALNGKISAKNGSVQSNHLANGSVTEEKLSEEVKIKLNEPQITVDSELSAESTNPVHNKTVKAELDKKLGNESGSVQSNHLANGSVTEEKLSEEVKIKLNKPQITVDSELSAESENPAQNKAIANSLSNAVKGKVTGEILRIDDISPIPHSLKIRAESKNLIDFNQIQNVGYAEPTIIENGFRLTGGYYAGIKNISVLPNTKYYLSYTTDNISGTTKNVAVFADNNTSSKITAFTNGTGGYFDSGDCNMVMIAFYASASNTSGTVEFTNIQLEYGTKSTEYKPYVDVSDVTVKQYGTQQTESEPIAEAIVSEDGTVEGLTSIYPNMVLAADSEGVTLECEYNRDLNKVINNIIDAVISLGGNV